MPPFELQPPTETVSLRFSLLEKKKNSENNPTISGLDLCDMALPNHPPKMNLLKKHPVSIKTNLQSICTAIGASFEPEYRIPQLQLAIEERAGLNQQHDASVRDMAKNLISSYMNTATY